MENKKLLTEEEIQKMFQEPLEAKKLDSKVLRLFTGKGGAIEALKSIGHSDKEIEAMNLKEGAYRISSDPNEDFVKYMYIGINYAKEEKR